MTHLNSSETNDTQKPVRVIRAYRSKRQPLLRDMYEARHMFWNMVRTSALLPYNDMALGVLWTMVRPITFLLVVVFIKHSSGAQMGAEGLEYSLFVFSGIISWWYFSDATSRSAESIFNHRNIITKMYFPRIIIPVMPVVSRAFDWMMQFVVLAALMAYFGRMPDGDLWLLPLSILNLMLLALAIGFICSVLSTHFRDMQQILGNILYVTLFLSPVIFSPELVPEKFRLLYVTLNPTVGPLTNLRAGLFDVYSPDYAALAISYGVTFLLLVIGFLAYTRIEEDLAEKIL